MDHAAKGLKASETKDFAAAISHYTKALAVLPNAVDYYIKRSTAYQRLSPPDHNAALADAEQALSLAVKRQKRELITQAQLRRGIALFSLGRYGDADFVFRIVKEMNPKEKSLPVWEAKVATKLEALNETDEKRQVTVQKVPEVAEPKAEQAAIGSSSNADSTRVNGGTNTTPTVTKAEGVQTPSQQIRHEWYQNNENVYFSLFAKGIPEAQTELQIQQRLLSISFPLPNSSNYEYTLDPLFAAIDPAKSQTKLMSTKLEITLRKSVPGVKWSALEGREDPSSTGTAQKEGQGSEQIKSAVLQAAKPAVTTYPTSSRTGPKDWDKVAEDLTKKPPKKKKGNKDDDDDEEPEDNWDDDDGGDPVNGFFKKLYAGADPDTRRAMMKSYQESNGTALSTNWSEVGKGKVETSPPEGMEAKNWEI